MPVRLIVNSRSSSNNSRIIRLSGQSKFDGNLMRSVHFSSFLLGLVICKTRCASTISMNSHVETANGVISDYIATRNTGWARHVA